ncbi:hypothetical protein [Pseudoalteromonas sp. bablab_jr004]|uniref:hypothetical protein n=1 Tax=Pseudoalteromonas sp. bablab_jr004 TaxID=2755065 RepID=UPI0018F6DA7A|nr:hypothetical protein [Pseudoalteromonas sp. bablab_jr004]
MSNSELSNTVKQAYFDEAKASLDMNGRYWNSSIPRPSATELLEQLRCDGYEVSVQEIKPVWEHVFYLPEYENGVDDIAIQRALIMETEDEPLHLPT